MMRLIIISSFILFSAALPLFSQEAPTGPAADDLCESCQQNRQDSKDLSGLPIKIGMSKHQVVDILGRPDHILGQDDPFYLEDKQQQKEKYGYITEVWYYLHSEKSVVYIRDGKVSGLGYLGPSDPLPNEKRF